jgi:hypothetical protein
VQWREIYGQELFVETVNKFPTTLSTFPSILFFKLELSNRYCFHFIVPAVDWCWSFCAESKHHLICLLTETGLHLLLSLILSHSFLSGICLRFDTKSFKI